MKEIRTVLLFSIFLFSFLLAKGKTKNIIFITFDGLRWEEVFYGADSLLIHSEKYTKDQSQILKDYWNSSYRIRREKLMPFFWNTIINQGQLYGNVRNGSIATLENPYLFSYPGYSEMLVGYVDLTRNSNNKENNPNITVLEYIHNQPGYNNKVAAFCSWDVFDFIINEKRSGIYVSAGMESYGKGRNNPKIGLLNEIMLQIPVPWKSVRYDAITHNFAKTYLEEERPKLLYIAYDETDEYAHEGKYDQYLIAANRLDKYDIYVSIEPCPMCATAIAKTHIRRLYFGAEDKKGGGVINGPKIYSHSNLKTPEVISHCYAEETGNLLKKFFESKRN